MCVRVWSLKIGWLEKELLRSVGRRVVSIVAVLVGKCVVEEAIVTD